MRIISITILVILVLVYFAKLNRYESSSDFINYQLRSLYHANLQHMIANGISFFALSFIETVLGWKLFLFTMIFLWFVSNCILFTIHAAIPSRKVKTVGFSGVIMGLIVVYISLLNKNPTINIIGLIASILPQFFTVGISFEGHLSGIIAGIILVTIFRPLYRNLQMDQDVQGSVWKYLQGGYPDLF